MTTIRSLPTRITVGGTGPTYLAMKAALLKAGQSIRLETGLTSAMLTLDNSNFLQWGVSMYHDPTRKQVGYIGKRDGPNSFRWAIYDERSNTWDTSRPVAWSSAGASGHGYDHNTSDKSTGDVYHVPFGSNVVQKFDGASWSALPAWTQNTTALGGLTYAPGLGLFYNDGFGLLHFNGSAWVTLAVGDGSSYHDFSEWNDAAKVLVFGGGNSSGYFRMTSALEVAPISAPPAPIALGASPQTQGVVVSDPRGAMLIGRHTSTGTWASYDIATDHWALLTTSTGSGAVPQDGPPNLPVDSNNQPVAVSLDDTGVMMFVQHQGSGSTPAEVWLYRHT